MDINKIDKYLNEGTKESKKLEGVMGSYFKIVMNARNSHTKKAKSAIDKMTTEEELNGIYNQLDLNDEFMSEIASMLGTRADELGIVWDGEM